MIDDADARLKEWVTSVSGAVDVSLGLPREVKAGRAVNLYLLEMLQTPQPRGPKRPPLEVTLRYLVTSSADSPEEAHRILGALVFAAMEQSDFEVESERVSGETWMALGLPPRASFVLRLPVRKERPEAPVKLVRRPVMVSAVGTSTLYGVVVSPEDTPIVQALIEIPALQLIATTDRDGRFHFPTVPSEPRKKVLRIRARGRQFNVTTEQPTSVTDPLVIRFNPMEV